MIDERYEELASLFVFDLLDGAERAEFESALAREPALQALVRELRESAAAFAHTAPAAAPPAALKDRVLASAGLAPARDAKILNFAVWIPWSLAAGFAGLAAWLGQLYLVSHSEVAFLREQQTIAELAFAGAHQQIDAERILAQRHIADLGAQAAESTRRLEEARKLLAARDASLAEQQQLIASIETRARREADLANFKITTLASLLKNSPQALAVAVWNPTRQEGVLRVEKLPALAADQDYQLWIVDPRYPNPVDGGVFTVDPQTGEARVSFTARQPVEAIDAFAVTLERKGGVPKAEGPFVLLGKQR